MELFLDFLNSAEASELTKLSGIDTAMAERIIEARPFESEEDAMRVNGLGEKSLENLKAAFEKLDQIILVGNQTPARSQEKNTNATITIKTEGPQEKEEKEEKKGFLYYVGRFFRGLFILLIIAIIVGGFGYGLYIGIPYFVDNIIKPIQDNTSQISAMTTQQAQDLQAMEEEISGLQTQFALLQEQSNINVDTLDTQSEHIAAMATMQMAMNNNIATLEADLGEQIDEQEAALLASIEYNLKVSQAIQMLSRSNLYLAQSNYGQARQDISSAYTLLENYIENAPTDKQEFLQKVADRMEMAIYNLPTYPVVAANDLQIAWQYLVDNNNPSEPINMPILTAPVTVTLTPYDIPSYTPTPYPPITPTAVATE